MNFKKNKYNGDFGWSSIFRSLSIRKLQIFFILLATFGTFGASLLFPLISQKAIDRAVDKGIDTTFIILGVVAAMSIIMELVFLSIQKKHTDSLCAFFDNRFNRLVFLHYLQINPFEFESTPGEANVTFQSLSRIRGFVLQALPAFVIRIGSAFISLVLVFNYDTLIGFLIGAVAVYCAWYIPLRLEGLNDAIRQYSVHEGRKQSCLAEVSSNFETVKILVIEKALFMNWRKAVGDVVNANMETLNLIRRNEIESQAITQFTQLAVILIGSWKLFADQMSIGELVALQILSARVLLPAMSSGNIIKQYREANNSIDRVRQFMNLRKEAPRNRPAPRNLGDQSISVRELTVKFPGRDIPTLDRLTIDFPTRGVVAIVGRNGSGKTTLLRVLLGILRQFDGEVRIGGTDLDVFEPRWIRHRIGSVNQDTQLFNGTIRDNLIAVAANNVSDDAIWSALETTRAKEFVLELPNGLDTQLVNGARNLSGGQRQKLAITRALLKDSPIIVLDEPTSSLDVETAMELERRLLKMSDSKLIFLVTHHLLAARDADQIIVLDRGSIRSIGTHAELLDSCDDYTQMWNDYMRAKQ